MEARSDVAYRADGAGLDRLDSGNQQEEEGNDDHHSVESHKREDHDGDVILDGTSLGELDLADGRRMGVAAYLAAYGFDGDKDPVGLESAARAAGTGTAEHDHENSGLCKGRPEIKVSCCKTG